MGSLFNLVIYTSDSLQAAVAAAHVYRLIDTLNDIYSDYSPSSELNRLCAQAGNNQWVSVSAPLFNILSIANKAAKWSGGSFDITAGPLIRLWRTARHYKRLPDADSLKYAMTRVGYRFMLLDSANQKVKLLKPGMQLDLGGIAKGETGQRVCARLRELGFPYSLVDAGGDIIGGPVPPSVKGWNVAINLPESEETMSYHLLINNYAVTTSGDLYQYVDLNGKRYSHIINPLTGFAITNSRNVTVISPHGINADWLTKACSILPVNKAFQLVKKFPGTEVQIAVLKNGKPFYYRSAGFKSYLNKP